VSPLLDHHQPVACCETQNLLRQPPADTRSGRDGVDAEAAHAFGRDLVTREVLDLSRESENTAA
jgi:hypothetical protein